MYHAKAFIKERFDVPKLKYLYFSNRKYYSDWNKRLKQFSLNEININYHHSPKRFQFFIYQNPEMYVFVYQLIKMIFGTQKHRNMQFDIRKHNPNSSIIRFNIRKQRKPIFCMIFVA